MVARLSSETGKIFFFLLMVLCCFEVILCRSLDALGPWQPWTRCSVSCGEGEQTRRRHCLYPPTHQMDRKVQTMHAEFTDCHGNKSVVTRRACKLKPCTYFKTESDSWSPQSYLYPSSDQARVLHRRQDKHSAAMFTAYASKDDGSCSVIDQSLVCRNETDEHVRLGRAIRLSLGEMIYSKWTPWTTCSCTTSTQTRYRFCIVGKRQCLRAKGRFPTQEESLCECGATRGSKNYKRKRLLSRKYPSQKSDPYTPWTRWGRCPCKSNAFRIRNRMCRPGHAIACSEEKQRTGIGIVQLKRCRPPRRCQGLQGPVTDLLAERKPLPEQPHPPLKSVLVRQPPSPPLSHDSFGSGRKPLPPPRPPPRPPPPEISSGPLAQETLNRFVSRSEEQPPRVADAFEPFETDESSVPEELRQAVQTTTTTSAPPWKPMPVQPRLRWSPWSEWTACSKTCGGGNTYRWRECLDEQDQLTVGCEGGDYTELQPCNTQLCPVESPGVNRESVGVPAPAFINQQALRPPTPVPVPVPEIIPMASLQETITQEPNRLCRAFTSDTTRTGPRRRDPITTVNDERNNDECPAYYGLTFEPPTPRPPPPPRPAAQTVKKLFNLGANLFRAFG